MKTVTFLSKTDSQVEHEIKEDIVVFIGYTHTKDQYERGFYKKKKRKKRSSTSKPVKDLEIVEDPDSEYVNPTDTGAGDAVDEMLDDLTSNASSDKERKDKKDSLVERKKPKETIKIKKLKGFASLDRTAKSKPIRTSSKTKSWASSEQETLVESPSAPVPKIPNNIVKPKAKIDKPENVRPDEKSPERTSVKKPFSVSIVNVPGVPQSTMAKRKSSPMEKSDDAPQVPKIDVRSNIRASKSSEMLHRPNTASPRVQSDTNKELARLSFQPELQKNKVKFSPTSPSPTSKLSSNASSPTMSPSKQRSSLLDSPKERRSADRSVLSARSSALLSKPAPKVPSPGGSPAMAESQRKRISEAPVVNRKNSEISLIKANFLGSPPSSNMSSPSESPRNSKLTSSLLNGTFSTSGSLNINFDDISGSTVTTTSAPPPKIVDIRSQTLKPFSAPSSRMSSPRSKTRPSTTLVNSNSTDFDFSSPPAIPSLDRGLEELKSRPKSVSMRKIKIQNGEIVDAKVIEMENGEKKVFIPKKAKERAKSMMLDSSRKPVLSSHDNFNSFEELPPPPTLEGSTDSFENFKSQKNERKSFFDKKKRRTTFAKLREFGNNMFKKF